MTFVYVRQLLVAERDKMEQYQTQDRRWIESGPSKLDPVCERVAHRQTIIDEIDDLLEYMDSE